MVFLLSGNFVFSQSKTEKNLIKNYKEEQGPSKRFWNLYDLSVYYKSYNFQKADSIRVSLLILSHSASDSARYLAQVYDAEMDLANGDKELYFSKIIDLQSFINQLPTPEVMLDLYQRLGEYHMYHREMKQANIYLRDALRTAKKLRNNREISHTYLLLSGSYMLANLKDSSSYYALETIQFARRSADKKVLAQAFNNQALIFNYFGQVELSVSKNLSALQLANEAGDNIQIAKFNIDIGEAQLSIGNYREAELYFLSAIESANRIKDKRTVALSQINLGKVYRYKKDYQKSLEFQRKALRLLFPYNDNDGLGEAHNTIGDVFRELRDFTNALRNYNKALVYFEISSNQEKIATVYHNVGYVFEQQGKYENALNYLNRSVDIRLQFGYKGSVYPTYQTISNVYFKTGNQNLAYRYLKMYTDYSDSSKTLESNTKIAELSQLYRSEQRERDNILKSDSLERQRQKIALNSSQLENAELKTNLQTYIIIGFIILMLLAGIIGFYRWNQTKIKQQQGQAEMNQTLLRAQMNPHFVFNAMSVIQSYIYDNDTVNSSKFLVNFSKLMRLILENSSKETIPIKIEFDILDKYLAIQKMRFEDRFEYNIVIDEVLYEEEAIIPPMITQPFIENAIEHGRLHLKDDGFINIRFYKEGEMLHITIIDNGIGRKGSELNKKSNEHKSMAMKITKDRIDNLNKKYRSEGYMLIEDYDKDKQTGTKVLISIPYRVANQI